jgi:hypothetical protein
MGPHLNWLAGTARAQADAQRLRSLYGAKAEGWCADALAALAPGDPRRGDVRRIIKALRALPATAGDGAEGHAGGSAPTMSPVPRRV